MGKNYFEGTIASRARIILFRSSHFQLVRTLDITFLRIWIFEIAVLNTCIVYIMGAFV